MLQKFLLPFWLRILYYVVVVVVVSCASGVGTPHPRPQNRAPHFLGENCA
jgi:hypothetical protein